MSRRIRVVRTPGGARLVQDDATLSRVRDTPGPTHGLFDLLAACVAVLAPGDRFLMLGFAAGGMVAPLRALGFDAAVVAIDRSPIGVGLFRELCGRWAGDVRVHRADAERWLLHDRRRWDAIVDDLSVPGPEGVTKPDVSLHALPPLLQRRLRSDGVAITNLLPHPGHRMSAIERLAAGPATSALAILPDGYENRILLTGRLPAAGVASRRLEAALRGIGSRVASRFGVRTRHFGDGPA